MLQGVKNTWDLSTIDTSKKLMIFLYQKLSVDVKTFYFFFFNGEPNKITILQLLGKHCKSLLLCGHGFQSGAFRIA